MSIPLPKTHKNIKLNPRTSNKEQLTGAQLRAFMKKNGIDVRELSELFGVSKVAVKYWLEDKRSISVLNTRLIQLFIKYPHLIKEF